MKRKVSNRFYRTLFGRRSYISVLLGSLVFPLFSQVNTDTVLDDPSATAVIKLEFGLKHSEPRVWTGEVAISVGSIGSAWGWHFMAPDRIEGDSGFHFQTRLFQPPKPPYNAAFKLPRGFTVLPNGVYLSLRALSTSVISVTTNHGDFSFRFSDLATKVRMSFLDGDVHAVYTPPVRALTRGEASQHDFPAATTVGEDLFVAWTTFHNEANAIYLARRRDDRWGTFRATTSWSDYSGTAIAAAGDGSVHVIWSEYKDDRWRLVDRLFDPQAETWQPERYIAPGGNRQLFPQAATDASGRPWVVWQEFSEDNLEVKASFWDGEVWVTPLRISESQANNWSPSIAAAPDGSVWFAWDSYDAGNYDVRLRALRNGSPESVIQVTQSPTRDAYPSVAVDAGNSVWIAWSEMGANWGKDWGVLGNTGTLIHEGSRIRLVRYANGRLTEPAVPLQDAVPGWMSGLHEYPTVTIGPNGLPYVFFRKSKFRIPIREHNLRMKIGDKQSTMPPWLDTVNRMSSIQMIGFNGSGWSAVRELPLSQGGVFAPVTAAVSGERLTFVWSSDGRSYPDPHFRTSQLRYVDFDLQDQIPAQKTMKAFSSPPGGVPDAAPTEAADLARVRAVRWEDKQPLRLFRGDLHRHTDISADSEQDGDILDAYRYALDAGALDFMAITDHSGAERMHFYKYQWWRTGQIATMFTRPGRFVSLFGYERTVSYPGGHRNIISSRRDMQPVPISDEEFTGVESWAERLYPNLRKTGDIAIPHTTATGGGTDWRDGDPRVEPVVEVFQGARGAYEEANGPGIARSANRPDGLVWNAWAKGRKIGIIASSDHRSTHQSYAGVYAPELTRNAILSAIKQRRTFGATDNIVLQFEAIGSDGRKFKMGSEIRTSKPPQLRVRIEGTAELESVELIRNSQIVYSRNPGARSVKFSFRDSNPLKEEAHYHVRVVQKNRQIAWSSPIWVR